MKKTTLASILLILLTAVGLSAVSFLEAQTPVVSIEEVGENLKLDWEDITGAISYQVYEADAPEGPWSPILPAALESEYLITNPSSKKFYYVTAIEADGPPAPENFVFVQGGTFHNGTGNVTISSFYMHKYEVTQAEYQTVPGWNQNPSYFAGNPNFPVERVTWLDAITYCNARSSLEGLTPPYHYYEDGIDYGTDIESWPQGWDSDIYYLRNISCDWSANGYRLPTEMEWMYAAKGGALTPASGYSTYAGSNVLDDVGWYLGNSGSSPHTVGTKLPNELGIYDMTGNVNEWCWGSVDPYSTEDQTDPRGSTGGEYRAVRGGSWNHWPESCTISFRGSNFMIGGDSYLGFRVVRGSL
ncbi:MAG: formylglycine-generating enzyme family protein [Candidatus Cloacimonetes bacterium]|nr:formylglycine-generating enzyme family protein [Candidatus Cloacimonadota bacterium]MCK9243237.1 formylglycine-generating enzyme family protein [Candidatus Cloacimonadota bacterium]